MSVGDARTFASVVPASDILGVHCKGKSLIARRAQGSLCTDNRIVRIEWSRYAANELLQTRLVELEGSHSPFLSRPAELAAALQRVAVEG